MPPGAWEARRPRQPAVEIRSVSSHTVAGLWSGVLSKGWEGTIDGAHFAVERGAGGDHRFVHGASPDSDGVPSEETRAVHHLDASGSVLSCAPSDPTDPRWWRVVLDSVLFTAGLLHGYEALHAAAVVAPDGAIAITAASGGGKSTLLSELLSRGLALLADDVLVLEARGIQAPLAHPAPPLMTIPATRAASLPIAPDVICTVEDELWVAAPVHPEPIPLKALVVLDRRRGGELSLAKIDSPLAPLLDALMKFPRTPDRELVRFELASMIAGTTEQWRLTADLETPPGILADKLLAGVS
jgi:hypothetical protein